MARPIKKGIDYYSIDVDFLRDIKIRKIMRSCGIATGSILLSLLGNIYRDEGYYAVWDSDMCFLVADEVGTKESAVDELVKRATEVGFFDNGMFEKYHILTSHGIQARYEQAARQKKNHHIEPKFSLLRVSNVENRVTNTDNYVSNVESTQSILKDTKGNNSKSDNTKPKVTDDQLRERFNLGFWLTYPKKQGFDKAFDEFKIAIDNGFSPDDIETGAKKYAEYCKIKKRTEQYTKNPDNWIAEHRWTDTLDMTPDPPRQGQKTTTKETLPGWAQAGATSTATRTELTPEQQAEISARIARLQQNREPEQEATP
ncbi:DUF4373 domain-containing protein [Levilactobacillus brevis]|uniref:DUF4373 domain-containing protein n=1 Tax=Levilactobacillus brevis TaxID=1580 RepID=UPI0018C0AA85|nr:DUF4373 domain-containing protein [Levilactobacillus brevis]QOX67244.1 DUF4373 domain-containing protein [Levilactobacillus brevis]